MPATKDFREQVPLFSNWLRRTGHLLGLDYDIAGALDLAEVVREGFRPAAIERLIERGLSERLIFEIVIPRRTYQRRRTANQNLTPDESDRAERFARLLSLASLVFEDDEKAVHWLNTPKRRFEERAPLDLAASSSGARAVEDVLLRAYYGFSA